VKVWALPPLPSRSLPHPEGVLAAVLTADGKRLITGGKDKIVRAWNPTNKQVERQYSGHTGSVTAVAVSPNGQVLVSADEDGILRFWNQTSGQQVGLIGAHDKVVASLSFHPDG